MSELEGKLTITMPSTSTGKSVMRILLKDPEAVQELRIEIGLEEFARAIGHEAFQPCIFELPEHFGKVRECKQVTVPLPKKTKYGMDDTIAKKLLEPFWVDGWTGGILDLMSFKNRDSDGNGVVSLYRWKDRDGEEAEESLDVGVIALVERAET